MLYGIENRVVFRSSPESQAELASFGRPSVIVDPNHERKFGPVERRIKARKAIEKVLDEEHFKKMREWAEENRFKFAVVKGTQTLVKIWGYKESIDQIEVKDARTGLNFFIEKDKLELYKNNT